MKETANSRIVNITGININKITPLLTNAFPSKDINRCPAIKLAVSRTHKVTGRIILLTSSIKTINIIRTLGVPWGTKWESILLVLLIHPNNIRANQNTKDSGKFKETWEETENTCGYKATTLIIIMNINNDIINKLTPFSFLPRVKETSLEKIETSFLNKSIGEKGINQVFKGKILKKINKTIQEIEKVEIDGSKIEKRFVIIL